VSIENERTLQDEATKFEEAIESMKTIDVILVLLALANAFTVGWGVGAGREIPWLNVVAALGCALVALL
jgi:hypothetical protein